MPTILNVAVLGTGMIVQRAHLPAILANPSARLVALYGRDNDRTRQLHALAGTGALLHDLDVVFALPELDAVIIALPNYLHRQAVELAANRGVAVLCEKPLATTIEDARAMVAAMNKAKLPLAMSLPRRWRASLQHMDQLCQSGFFGDIVSVEVRMSRRAGIPGIGSWFTQRELSGGGVLADLGPHVLDMAMWLSGSTAVHDLRSHIGALHGQHGLGLGDWGSHQSDPKDRRFDVDDFANLQWTAGNGARINCEMSWATFGPDENRTRVIGTKGGADYWPEANPDNPLTLYSYDGDGAPADNVSPLPADHDNLDPAWRACVDDFIGSTLACQIPTSSGGQALIVAELIDAAYRAAATRKPSIDS